MKKEKYKAVSVELALSLIFIFLGSIGYLRAGNTDTTDEQIFTQADLSLSSSDHPDRILGGPSKFSFSASVGMAYRFDNFSDPVRIEPFSGQALDLQEYEEELKTGRSYTFELQYFIIDEIGLGFRYSGFRTSNLAILKVQTEFGNYISGYLEDRIAMDNYGLGLYGRHRFEATGHCFYGGFAISYINYRNDASMFQAYKFRGTGFGINSQLGYFFSVYKNFEVGVKASLETSWLLDHEYAFPDDNVDNSLQNNDINLLNFNLAIRFSE